MNYNFISSKMRLDMGWQKYYLASADGIKINK